MSPIPHVSTIQLVHWSCDLIHTTVTNNTDTLKTTCDDYYSEEELWQWTGIGVASGVCMTLTVAICFMCACRCGRKLCWKNRTKSSPNEISSSKGSGKTKHSKWPSTDYTTINNEVVNIENVLTPQVWMNHLN